MKRLLVLPLLMLTACGSADSEDDGYGHTRVPAPQVRAELVKQEQATQGSLVRRVRVYSRQVEGSYPVHEYYELQIVVGGPAYLDQAKPAQYTMLQGLCDRTVQRIQELAGANTTVGPIVYTLGNDSRETALVRRDAGVDPCENVLEGVDDGSFR